VRRSASPAGTRNISIEHTASARIAERCSCATAAVHLGAANACGLGITLQPKIALFCLNTWNIRFGQLESLVSRLERVVACAARSSDQGSIGNRGSKRLIISSNHPRPLRLAPKSHIPNQTQSFRTGAHEIGFGCARLYHRIRSKHPAAWPLACVTDKKFCWP